MKETDIIALVIVVMLLFLVVMPVAWTATGWVILSVIEYIRGEEITSKFWAWQHFVTGLALSLVAGAFRGKK